MNEPGLRDIWVYLSASPLLGLTITLVAYGLAYRLYLKTHSNPLANPVVTSVAMLILLLLATGTSYSDYFEGGQFVHFLLGPATVALAVPLYQQFRRLRQLWLPVKCFYPLPSTEVKALCSLQPWCCRPATSGSAASSRNRF